MREAVIFVVDGAKLEAMSVLLAASLARHTKAGNVSMIAYITAKTKKRLQPGTRALYAACEVTIADLPGAKGVWRKKYPHGNKILACAEPRDCDRTTFLDTDMICQGQITDLSLPDPASLAAVPEGLPTWGKDSTAWTRAYGHFGLPVPEARVTLTRGKRLAFPPYFNAGFLSFPEKVATQPDKTFGQLWLETARDFDFNCAIADKRPWLDQVTLPLTLARYGIPFHALSDLFNFSISERARLGHTRKAAMIHYHKSEYLDATALGKGIREMVFDKVPPKRRDSMVAFLTQFFPNLIPAARPVSS